MKHEDSSQPYSYMVQVRDITDRKRDEIALRDERNRAQLYLDISGVMFVALDNQGRIAMLNKEACLLLECDFEDVVGKNWFETFVPESARDAVIEIFLQLMNGEITSTEHFRNKVMSTSGVERLIQWHNETLRDGDGNITGTLGSGHDITEQMEAEKELNLEKSVKVSMLKLQSYDTLELTPHQQELSH